MDIFSFALNEIFHSFCWYYHPLEASLPAVENPNWKRIEAFYAYWHFPQCTFLIISNRSVSHHLCWLTSNLHQFVKLSWIQREINEQISLSIPLFFLVYSKILLIHKSSFLCYSNVLYFILFKIIIYCFSIVLNYTFSLHVYSVSLFPYFCRAIISVGIRLTFTS